MKTSTLVRGALVFLVIVAGFTLVSCITTGSKEKKEKAAASAAASSNPRFVTRTTPGEVPVALGKGEVIRFDPPSGTTACVWIDEGSMRYHYYDAKGVRQKIDIASTDGKMHNLGMHRLIKVEALSSAHVTYDVSHTRSCARA